MAKPSLGTHPASTARLARDHPDETERRTCPRPYHHPPRRPTGSAIPADPWTVQIVAVTVEVTIGMPVPAPTPTPTGMAILYFDTLIRYDT